MLAMAGGNCPLAFFLRLRMFYFGFTPALFFKCACKVVYVTSDIHFLRHYRFWAEIVGVYLSKMSLDLLKNIIYHETNSIQQ